MSSSPQPIRSRALLIGLIRGLGALLAAWAVLTLIYLLCSQVIDVLHGRMGSLGWLSVVIGTVLMLGILGFIFAIGYKIFREVNAKTVAEFSGVLALTAAFDYRYWEPLLFPQYSDAKHFAFFVFVFLFRPTKNIFLRVLQLNPPPPKVSSADDSIIPEFPKRSPLIEL